MIGYGNQFGFWCDDCDIFLSDSGQYTGTELVIASSKQKSLSADRRNDDAKFPLLYIIPKFFFCDIFGDQLLIPDNIHTQKLILDSQPFG